jgi:hypothetical protein
MEIDRNEFEKWAVTQPDFTLYNGELIYCHHYFWTLVKECQKAPIEEFLSLQNEVNNDF